VLDETGRFEQIDTIRSAKGQGRDCRLTDAISRLRIGRERLDKKSVYREDKIPPISPCFAVHCSALSKREVSGLILPLISFANDRPRATPSYHTGMCPLEVSANPSLETPCVALDTSFKSGALPAHPL